MVGKMRQRTSILHSYYCLCMYNEARKIRVILSACLGQGDSVGKAGDVGGNDDCASDKQS